MTVRRVLFSGDTYDVTGTGTDAEGTFERDGETVDPDGLRPVLEAGFLCNNAEPAPDGDDQDYFGDPTEVAIRVAAEKGDAVVDRERLREIPFSSERKRMTTVN
ncbi:MAG: haloacid dehalogenase, partial [Candidatus Nanohaloarchaea archaeon]